MKRTFRLHFILFAFLAIPAAFAQGSGDGTIQDPRDGQVYEIVQIGSHWWMAENLNYDAGSGSWCYDDNTEACKVFGRLYNWKTATTACPSGWHLPDDKEWQDLEKALGMSDHYLDQTGWRNFENDLLYAEDQGLRIIMAGYRPYGDGSFDDIKDDAYFWTSSSYDNSNAWKRYLDDNRMQIGRGYDSKLQGFSVRCVKD
jgi:uncharacterized protein (TIGR02145 family)